MISKITATYNGILSDVKEQTKLLSNIEAGMNNIKEGIDSTNSALNSNLYVKIKD